MTQAAILLAAMHALFGQNKLSLRKWFQYTATIMPQKVQLGFGSRAMMIILVSIAEGLFKIKHFLLMCACP